MVHAFLEQVGAPAGPVLEEGGRRGATVMALEATEALSIDRGQFLELRRRYPGVDRFIFDVLMANIRRVNVQLMEALFVPVDRRVVRRLLSLAEIYASKDQVDDVEVALTQDDLASLAGTSRATVNRMKNSPAPVPDTAQDSLAA